MPIIRVVDFETTGMHPDAEVIEAARSDLIPKADCWTVDEPVSWLCGVKVNHPDARATHHIQTHEVMGMPPFDGGRLLESKDPIALFAFHYAAFDTKFWTPPGKHVCTWKAALRVWPDAPSHSNGALRYWLEDRGEIAVDEARAWPPHRAGPDAYITAHLLKALLAHQTARQMEAWTREPALLPRLTIGKQRGAKWPDVEESFLHWMLKQGDMEIDLKWNAQRELDRRRNPTPPEESF
jgi:exodeoxyribonuclease X